MPNYEIVKKFCVLRKREVRLPATYVSEPGGSDKLVEDINDCMDRDSACAATGCRFCAGTNDPFGENA